MVNYDTKEYTSQIVTRNKGYGAISKEFSRNILHQIMSVVAGTLDLDWQNAKTEESGGCYKASGFCTVNGIRHRAVLGLAGEYATLIVISAEGEDDSMELTEIILHTLSYKPEE